MPKIEVKLAGQGRITDPGYYTSLFKAMRSSRGKPTDDEPKGPQMVDVDLEIEYEDTVIEWTDRMYATVGPNSKLTSFCTALGYADDYESLLATIKNEGGMDLDKYIGKAVRSHWETKKGRDGNSYVQLTGYLGPKRRTTMPGSEIPEF